MRTFTGSDSSSGRPSSLIGDFTAGRGRRRDEDEDDGKLSWRPRKKSSSAPAMDGGEAEGPRHVESRGGGGGGMECPVSGTVSLDRFVVSSRSREPSKSLKIVPMD